MIVYERKRKVKKVIGTILTSISSVTVIVAMFVFTLLIVSLASCEDIEEKLKKINYRAYPHIVVKNEMNSHYKILYINGSGSTYYKPSEEDMAIWRIRYPEAKSMIVANDYLILISDEQFDSLSIDDLEKEY